MLLHGLFSVHSDCAKASVVPKKSRSHDRDFFLLLLELCCARPRFKSLTCARSAHSASRTQRTEKPDCRSSGARDRHSHRSNPGTATKRRSHWARNSTSSRQPQRNRRIHRHGHGCRPANLKNRSSLCRCHHRTNRRWSSSGHQPQTHRQDGRSAPSTRHLKGHANRLDTATNVVHCVPVVEAAIFI